MVTGAEILARTATAGKYMNLLARLRELVWTAVRDEYELNSSVETGLILIHPHWFGDEVLRHQMLDPRGARSLAGPSAKRRDHCDSANLWGYACPFVTSQAVSDHYWPYALGGPGGGANLVSLCRMHNDMKSSDIHVFAFEKTPDWLVGAIGRVAAIRALN